MTIPPNSPLRRPSLVIALDSFCFHGGRGKINLGIGLQTKSAQMPNGFAEYKSVKDAPSVFLRDRVALIFNGLPCVSEREINLRRLANFAAHAGNHRKRGAASSEGSCHHHHRSAESRLFLRHIDEPGSQWLNLEVKFSHKLPFASVGRISAVTSKISF